MHYREVLLEDDKSVGDSGTLTVDINLRDWITALIVRFKAQNYSTGAVQDQPPEMQISKVELVDGGQVYYSLNGPMAVAAAVYGLGRWPATWYDERASVSVRCNFPLLFGRYIGDPDFGFDPTKLVNPQLKVTWTDQALYTNDSLTIGVTARVMEGVPSPAKCLLWKEIEAWSSASAGVHTVDLPTDYPYRALLMRPYLAADIITSIWTHYKLDCDVGKLIPFDLDVAEFMDIVKQEFGPYILRKFDKFFDGGYAQSWLGETINVVTGTDVKTVASAYSAFWSRYVQKSKDFGGAGYDDVNVQVQATGYFPHSSILYPFGRWMEPDTWFRASQYGDVDLKITEGIAAAAAAVAVQQPRSLP